MIIPIQLLKEKERSLAALYSQTSHQEKQLRDLADHRQAAQTGIEGLRRELRDAENVLGTQEAEITSLSEQLTEV